MSEELLFTAISLLITLGLLAARGFFMTVVKSRMDRCYVITFPDDRGAAGCDRHITSVGQNRIPSTVKISISTQFLIKRASGTTTLWNTSNQSDSR